MLADKIRFAFVTCQDWPSGHYTAYRDLLHNDLDLVCHLGDYTYEYAIDSTRRGIPAPTGFEEECRDLRTYRLRHTLYKLDPDLQAAHARFPFAVIWDDHEVANDYSGVAPENPVFLTGDWHSTFVNDLKLDFKDPRARTVATEFVTPAITTGGDSTPYGPYYAPMVPYNPHIKYYEGDRRGYFKATITPELMELDLRFMTSVEDADGTGYTERSFVVENGVPGARPA